MDSFRTFIAIELPGELRALVIQHIARLRLELPDVRASWTREDNLHLTLKFLGNVPVADIAKVSDAVARATKTIAPFELTISGCGVFPTHGRPNVLWLGIESEPPAVAGGPALRTPALNLHALHESIETELAAVGFEREPRPFHPHLTIARLRRPQGGRPLAELHKRLGFPPHTITVSEVVVFRSTLKSEGSEHSPLSRHKLVRPETPLPET